MKIYYNKKDMVLGIIFLSLALILATIYGYITIPQLKSINEGIEIKAKVNWVQSATSLPWNAHYTAKVTYENPVSKLINTSEVMVNSKIEQGETISLYYLPEDGSLIHKNMDAINNILIYYIIGLLVPAIWMFVKIIKVQTKIKFLKKNGKILKAKITEVSINPSILFCEYTEGGKTLKFVSENVDLKKYKKGFSIGDTVNVYVIEDNLSHYYIALEEL